MPKYRRNIKKKEF